MVAGECVYDDEKNGTYVVQRRRVDWMDGNGFFTCFPLVYRIMNGRAEETAGRQAIVDTKSCFCLSIYGYVV